MVRLHIFPVIFNFAAFGAVTLSIKADTFLPVCTALRLVGKPDTTAEWLALTC